MPIFSCCLLTFGAIYVAALFRGFRGVCCKYFWRTQGLHLGVELLSCCKHYLACCTYSCISQIARSALVLDMIYKIHRIYSQCLKHYSYINLVHHVNPVYTGFIFLTAVFRSFAARLTCGAIHSGARVRFRW